MKRIWAWLDITWYRLKLEHLRNYSSWVRFEMWYRRITPESVEKKFLRWAAELEKRTKDAT